MTATTKAGGKKRTDKTAPKAATPALEPVAYRMELAEMEAIQAAEAREAEQVAAFKAERDAAAAAEPAAPPAVLTREFFTAGRAVFTVELPAAFIQARAEQGETWHDHYVFGVRRSTYNGREFLLVDNFVAYEKPVYLGKLREDTGEVVLTPGSKFPADATRVKVVTKVLKAIWEGRGEQIAAAGWRVMHDGKCSKCRRQLTDPLSLDRGIGPDCYEMVCGKPEEFVRF